MPAPFIAVPTTASFSFEAATASHASLDFLNWTIPAASQDTITVNVNNTGNVDATVRLEIRPQNLARFNWTLRIVNYTVHGSGPPATVAVNAIAVPIALNVTEYATVQILVGVPANSLGGTYTFGLRGDIRDPRRSTPIYVKDIDVNITVT